jgi:glycosyltransferase involved in cell wall biosynthesis
MMNVLRSYLAGQYRFFPFDTSRPAKKNLTDNWGYSAVLNAGVGRFLLGGLVTGWHLFTFPLVVVGRRIDLAQVQVSAWMTFWEGALYVLMARALGRPTLMRLGGDTDVFYEASSPRTRKLIEKVLGWPDGLIVQSDYWRSFVAGLGRTHNVFVVNNFIDGSWLVERSEPANAVPLFLFSAGLEAKRKGLAELMDAVALLKKEDVKANLRVVAASEAISDEVSTRGLGDLVQTKGPLEHSEMLEEYCACDAFLLPTHAEGFPNAMLEAMAAALPVIGTPVGSIPELVVEGQGGYIVPVGDVEQLKRRIVDLALDSEKRRQMGRFNRKQVEEKYTGLKVLPNLEAAYKAAFGLGKA